MQRLRALTLVLGFWMGGGAIEPAASTLFLFFARPGREPAFPFCRLVCAFFAVSFRASLRPFLLIAMGNDLAGIALA
jgi:hypothetical protein